MSAADSTNNGASSMAPPDIGSLRTEGRIEIDAAIVNNRHGQCFLPGAGKTEWFQDISGGPEMVVAPAGSFVMGSTESEPMRLCLEAPQHKVSIAEPFAIGRHAVTCGQFAAFLSAAGYDAGEDWRNPGFAQDDRHPVVFVSWKDAQAYAKWLRERTGMAYRLPTEAEWEYVCRAGTVTPFWWGTSITSAQANYAGSFTYGGGAEGEYRKGTTPVESFEANPWGLYQVHGNVWEWCEDVCHDDYNGASTDGMAWVAGGDQDLRVNRGGCWYNRPQDCRSARRGGCPPGDRHEGQGIRLARTLNL